MKYIPILLAVVGLGAATPALAAPNSNFIGPRIEATVGVDDVTNIRTNDLNYGAAAGADVPLGSRFTLGAEVNVDNIANYRDFGASARLGAALNDNLLVYGSAGYANLRGLDGLRLGGGAELSTGTPFYLKAEYRYTDFQNGIGRHAGLVGAGLRF